MIKYRENNLNGSGKTVTAVVRYFTSFVKNGSLVVLSSLFNQKAVDIAFPSSNM